MHILKHAWGHKFLSFITEWIVQQFIFAWICQNSSFKNVQLQLWHEKLMSQQKTIELLKTKSWMINPLTPKTHVFSLLTRSSPDTGQSYVFILDFNSFKLQQEKECSLKCLSDSLVWSKTQHIATSWLRNNFLPCVTAGLGKISFSDFWYVWDTYAIVLHMFI